MDINIGLLTFKQPFFCVYTVVAMPLLNKRYAFINLLEKKKHHAYKDAWCKKVIMKTNGTPPSVECAVMGIIGSCTYCHSISRILPK